MRMAIASLLVVSVFTPCNHAQTNGTLNLAGTEVPAAAAEAPRDSYAVFDATPAQEAALRSQIRQMHPDVLPLRIFFVPHWKYLANARIFRLHVPAGYASLMFTHLASRTVFIDKDRYLGEQWLGHWIAHELGHLATTSAKEEDAEKAAREFRRRLKSTSKGTCFQATPVGGQERKSYSS